MTGLAIRNPKQWADNGLAVFPEADVNANDGLPKISSAAAGQERALRRSDWRRNSCQFDGVATPNLR
jgi:hypothetical protein